MDVNAYVKTLPLRSWAAISRSSIHPLHQGEGLEKRVDDFAAEVAAAVKG